MLFNPAIHHRRSIRLRGYDYSQSGAYFLTICTQNREHLFGDIFNGNMQLNDAGQMIARWYRELEHKFPDVRCGDFVCMPNHIHFIIINVGTMIETVGSDLRVCPDNVCPNVVSPNGIYTMPDKRHAGGNHQGEYIGSPLPVVVQWFKTMTTNAYIDAVKHHGWRPFYKRLWQRNYYEHIVRNEADLSRIQQYIQNNPILWQRDRLYRQQEHG